MEQVKRCRICHRKLRDAESIRLGIGPVCRSRFPKYKKSRKAAGHAENMTIWDLLEAGEEDREKENVNPR